jgi:hypothetical protein
MLTTRLEGTRRVDRWRRRRSSAAGLYPSRHDDSTLFNTPIQPTHSARPCVQPQYTSVRTRVASAVCRSLNVLMWCDRPFRCCCSPSVISLCTTSSSQCPSTTATPIASSYITHTTHNDCTNNFKSQPSLSSTSSPPHTYLLSYPIPDPIPINSFILHLLPTPTTRLSINSHSTSYPCYGR